MKKAKLIKREELREREIGRKDATVEQPQKISVRTVRAWIDERRGRSASSARQAFASLFSGPHPGESF